ncbi:MAG: DUF3106 domain-containing protein [Thiolinea sp.]
MNKDVSAPRRHKQLVGVMFIVGSLFLLPSTVLAADLGWSQLSARERSVLKPFKSQWESYPAATKKTMRAWARLSSGERAQIKKRHTQWQALGASSKAKIIRKLDRYKRMPLSKRLKLKAWRKWVKSLPKAEQEKLHKRLPGMSTKQRKDYIRQLEKKYGKR